MAMHWILTSVGTAAASSPATGQEEALEGEFLDYLDTLEGEQEDWTWFSEKDEPAGADDAGAEEDAKR